MSKYMNLVEITFEWDRSWEYESMAIKALKKIEIYYLG